MGQRFTESIELERERGSYLNEVSSCRGIAIGKSNSQGKTGRTPRRKVSWPGAQNLRLDFRLSDALLLPQSISYMRIPAALANGVSPRAIDELNRWCTILQRRKHSRNIYYHSLERPVTTDETHAALAKSSFLVFVICKKMLASICRLYCFHLLCIVLASLSCAQLIFYC